MTTEPTTNQQDYSRSAMIDEFPTAALAEAELVLRNSPHDPDAQFQKAYALLVLDRLAESEAAIQLLCEQSPSYPDALWFRAGVLRRLRGDQDGDVLAAYEHVLESDPQNLYARSEYAALLRSCGRYREAQEITALLCAPGVCDDRDLLIEANFQLGAVSQALGDSASAVAAFRAVLAIDPDHTDALAMVELLAGLT